MLREVARQPLPPSCKRRPSASRPTSGTAGRAARRQKVLAVTVPAPMAHCIAAGHQVVLSRAWRVTWRGLLLIHASQAAHRTIARQSHVAKLLPDDPKNVVRSAIVAVAQIAGCHRESNGCCAPWGQSGEFHWQLTGVRRLPEPVTCDGAQKLWRPDRPVLAALADFFPHFSDILRSQMMTTPSPRPLSAPEAVALSLLTDDYTSAKIEELTGVPRRALCELAVARNIAVACATAEGAECHILRGEDPCTPCQMALGRAEAQERAQQRRSNAEAQLASQPADGQRGILARTQKRGVAA